MTAFLNQSGCTLQSAPTGNLGLRPVPRVCGRAGKRAVTPYQPEDLPQRLAVSPGTANSGGHQPHGREDDSIHAAGSFTRRPWVGRPVLRALYAQSERTLRATDTATASGHAACEGAFGTMANRAAARCPCAGGMTERRDRERAADHALPCIPIKFRAVGAEEAGSRHGEDARSHPGGTRPSASCKAGVRAPTARRCT